MTNHFLQEGIYVSYCVTCQKPTTQGVIGPIAILMRMSLEAHMSEYLVPSWWNCLERMRRCDLVEGATRGPALKFQKTCPIPSVCQPCDCVSRCEPLPQHHDCCHAPCHDAHGL